MTIFWDKGFKRLATVLSGLILISGVAVSFISKDEKAFILVSFSLLACVPWILYFMIRWIAAGFITSPDDKPKDPTISEKFVEIRSSLSSSIKEFLTIPQSSLATLCLTTIILSSVVIGLSIWNFSATRDIPFVIGRLFRYSAIALLPAILGWRFAFGKQHGTGLASICFLICLQSLIQSVPIIKNRTNILNSVRGSLASTMEGKHSTLPKEAQSLQPLINFLAEEVRRNEKDLKVFQTDLKNSKFGNFLSDEVFNSKRPYDLMDSRISAAEKAINTYAKSIQESQRRSDKFIENMELPKEVRKGFMKTYPKSNKKMRDLVKQFISIQNEVIKTAKSVSSYLRKHSIIKSGKLSFANEEVKKETLRLAGQMLTLGKEEEKCLKAISDFQIQATKKRLIN